MLYAYNQSVSDSNKDSTPLIAFMWESVNYLLKIKTDTNFLNSHGLSKFYNFSDKSDPFLVIPS